MGVVRVVKMRKYIIGFLIFGFLLELGVFIKPELFGQGFLFSRWVSGALLLAVIFVFTQMRRREK